MGFNLIAILLIVYASTTNSSWIKSDSNKLMDPEYNQSSIFLINISPVGFQSHIRIIPRYTLLD